ncbi:KAP family P-loop NTPase fold protein [Vogesella indigofera]|uniref:KAP family P-loop NTPase fold protein n=1 Tax=Vogesella indigofera TaxID=45465 RepID=UPI00234F66DD|nr:P-loop NTPase fold protein [Vogesella indigofera]MDC7701133.1 P-loop NTPase fold protein [Vogesella indigofera]
MTVSAFAADIPATEDLLGFTPHAQRLAATILQGLPEGQSFVIGIEGEWGEGKSSFIHFLKQAFPQGDTDPLRPTLVEFNPWWFEGSDQLLRHFFDELLGQIDWSHRLRDSVRTKLNLLGSAGVRVGKVLQACSIGCVEPATIAAVAAFGKSIETGAGAIHSNSQPKSFHRLRGNAANALKTLQFKTIVFIDDLDRLPASEICELFRVIKAVADLPNIVYVIAYDRAIVASALDSMHKDRGEAYLEKIIQLPYRLPTPKHSDRLRYHKTQLGSSSLLKEIVCSDDLEVKLALSLVTDAFLLKPRDVKRLLASLLTSRHVPAEIRLDPLDFVFLEALRLKDRALWRQLVAAWLDCQFYAQFDSSQSTSRESQRQTWLQSRFPDFDKRPAAVQRSVMFFTNWPLVAKLDVAPRVSTPQRLAQLEALFVSGMPVSDEQQALMGMANGYLQQTLADKVFDNAQLDRFIRTETSSMLQKRLPDDGRVGLFLYEVKGHLQHGAWSDVSRAHLMAVARFIEEELDRTTRMSPMIHYLADVVALVNASGVSAFSVHDMLQEWLRRDSAPSVVSCLAFIKESAFTSLQSDVAKYYLGCRLHELLRDPQRLLILLEMSKHAELHGAWLDSLEDYSELTEKDTEFLSAMFRSETGRQALAFSDWLYRSERFCGLVHALRKTYTDPQFENGARFFLDRAAQLS